MAVKSKQKTESRIYKNQLYVEYVKPYYIQYKNAIIKDKEGRRIGVDHNKRGNIYKEAIGKLNPESINLFKEMAAALVYHEAVEMARNNEIFSTIKPEDEYTRQDVITSIKIGKAKTEGKEYIHADVKLLIKDWAVWLESTLINYKLQWPDTTEEHIKNHTLELIEDKINITTEKIEEYKQQKMRREKQEATEFLKYLNEQRRQVDDIQDKTKKGFKPNTTKQPKTRKAIIYSTQFRES
jgi:hypothetical protein